MPKKHIVITVFCIATLVVLNPNWRPRLISVQKRLLPLSAKISAGPASKVVLWNSNLEGELDESQIHMISRIYCCSRYFESKNTHALGFWPDTSLLSSKAFWLWPTNKESTPLVLVNSTSGWQDVGPRMGYPFPTQIHRDSSGLKKAYWFNGDGLHNDFLAGSDPISPTEALAITYSEPLRGFYERNGTLPRSWEEALTYFSIRVIDGRFPYHDESLSLKYYTSNTQNGIVHFQSNSIEVSEDEEVWLQFNTESYVILRSPPDLPELTLQDDLIESILAFESKPVKLTKAHGMPE